jgi:hypothetical protein
MSITCSILASIFTRLSSGSRLIDNVVARGGRGLCVMGLGGCDMVQTVEEFGRRSALGIGRPQTSFIQVTFFRRRRTNRIFLHYLYLNYMIGNSLCCDVSRLWWAVPDRAAGPQEPPMGLISVCLFCPTPVYDLLRIISALIERFFWRMRIVEPPATYR